MAVCNGYKDGNMEIKNMYDKINELLNIGYKSKYYFNIIFRYRNIYSKMYIDCFLEAQRYNDNINILGTSSNGNGEEALNDAYSILEEINNLIKSKDQDFVFPYPKSDDQKFQEGYFRIEIPDSEDEIEFKRFKDKYYITRITKKDNNGFYYYDVPIKLEDASTHFERFEEFNIEKHKNLCRGFDKNTHKINYSNIPDVKDGEELYVWNSMKCLSGTSGFLIVKDGCVIKNKMILIS